MMNYLIYVSNNFNDIALLVSMDDKTRIKIGDAAVEGLKIIFYNFRGLKLDQTLSDLKLEGS